MPELTKVTSKGQVVIPSGIRKELKLKEGSQLAVSNIGGLVLMRKVFIPDPKREFAALTKFGVEFAKKKGIKDERDVVSRIHKSRGIKSG